MSDAPLQYTHSGSRYLLGYGEGFFGIWDRLRPDPGPAERFPRDDAGWAAAWIRYTALEPDHVVVGLGGAAGPPPSGDAAPGEEGTPDASRPAAPRIPGAWWLLPLLLGWIGGAIAWFALRRRDPRVAAWMFLAGIVSNVVGLWLYGQVVPPAGGAAPTG
ncbi:MAG: hypothetical protein ACKOKE_03695 [Actinomycetota bacterium]